MASPPDIRARVEGAIVGLAVVDALGAPVEFKARGTFPLTTTFLPNENFDTPPGAWTDDTSMALGLASALISNHGSYVPAVQLRNYVAWYLHGHLSSTGECFDIGGATRTALTIWDRYLRGINEEQPASPEAYREGQLEIDRMLKRLECCGNGSLMRICPIGLVWWKDPDTALKNAVRESNLTHPYPLNGEACAIYTTLVAAAMRGDTKDQMAAHLSRFPYQDQSTRTRLAGFDSLLQWSEKRVETIKSSGFVLDTLEAAIWSFFTTDTFAEGAIRVINLGDDADTVGAVYGGLAGAFYGVEAIPLVWRAGLQKREVVEDIAENLATTILAHLGMD